MNSNEVEIPIQFLIYTIPSVLFKWSSCVVIFGQDFEFSNIEHLTESFILCSFISIENIQQEDINGNLQKRNNFILFGETGEFVPLISKISCKFRKNTTTAQSSWFIMGNISEDSRGEKHLETFSSTNIHLLESFINLDINSHAFVGLYNKSSIEIFEVYKVCSTCPIYRQKLCDVDVTRANDIYGNQCQMDFYERRKNLNQLQLNAISVNVLPFFAEIETSSKFLTGSAIVKGGLFGTVFLTILEQLNATYNLTVLRGYRYGAFINGSWNGVMGYLSRGEVDLTVSELSLAPDRLSFIDYTTSFDSVGRKIYVKKIVQSKIINWNFYTSPFSPSVYVSIIFWITLMMILLCALEHLHNKKSNITFSLKESFWVSFSFLCQKGAHIIPTNRTSKIIFLTFGLTFLIIYSAYSATLISQLSVSPPVYIPFKNLQEFVSKAENWKGGPISGDLTQVYMEKTCPELLKRGENSQCELLVQLWNKIVKPDKDNLPTSFQEGLKRVLNEKFAFIATSFGARSQIASNFSEEDACNILEMSGDYISSNLAFGLRKNMPYRRLINYKLLQLQKSGVIKRLQKMWLPQQKQCSSSSSNYQEATINDVGFAPLVYSTGFLCSITLCIFELLYFHFHHIQHHVYQA